MIKGFGIDLTEISRIKKLTKEHDGFIDKILTKSEKKELKKFSDKRKIEYLAGRYSTKESFSKAIGTGIGKHVSFQDIEVLSDQYGKPYIITDKISQKIHVSISHTDELVMTQVIIEEI
ncbi:holo-ACP synthase [Companilactobacillus sp. DQM5]|uniref:holo-ACP synthase n=1 Tax=Companilactobacillus sp. DQM5 TaxID=3463359 RepID=UPI004057EFBC